MKKYIVILSLLIGLLGANIVMAKTTTMKFVQISTSGGSVYGLTKDGGVYFYTNRKECKDGQGQGGGGNVPCIYHYGWKKMSMNELPSDQTLVEI